MRRDSRARLPQRHRLRRALTRGRRRQRRARLRRRRRLRGNGTARRRRRMNEARTADSGPLSSMTITMQRRSDVIVNAEMLCGVE